MFHQLYFTTKDGFWHLPVAAFCSFYGAVSATAPYLYSKDITIYFFMISPKSSSSVGWVLAVGKEIQVTFIR
jgi:hypothetical protein